MVIVLVRLSETVVERLATLSLPRRMASRAVPVLPLSLARNLESKLRMILSPAWYVVSTSISNVATLHGASSASTYDEAPAHTLAVSPARAMSPRLAISLADAPRAMADAPRRSDMFS